MVKLQHNAHNIFGSLEFAFKTLLSSTRVAALVQFKHAVCLDLGESLLSAPTHPFAITHLLQSQQGLSQARVSSRSPKQQE